MTNRVGAFIPVTLASGEHPDTHPGAFLAATATPSGGLLLDFLDPIPPGLPSPGRGLLFNVTRVQSAGVTVVAEYDTGAYEIVHDGTAFAQVYAAASTRSVIAGGFQYLARRAGGWFGDTVTIRTIAAAASA